MDFSAQQQRALDSVAGWLQSPDKGWFYLAGYAGSGKTTLAKHFAATMDGTVLFAAFTGKAASVMRSKGCTEATTIHRLIYKPSAHNGTKLRDLMNAYTVELEGENRDEVLVPLKREIEVERAEMRKPKFRLNSESIVRQASLLIIDECSMISSFMAQDLLSFGTPVLVLGDPAQLPPVGAKGYFTEHDPDYLLTEIHRQARESGILRLATDVREGKSLTCCDYGDAAVINGIEDPNQVLEYDQILVGRNATRRASNVRYRELKGFSLPYPEPGERIVCLKNNHELGLLNGETYNVDYSSPYSDDELLVQLAISNDELSEVVDASTRPFRGEDIPLAEKHKEVQEFDFGYCMTVHKSQGSQWPNVLVFDQSASFGNHRRNHLYTAITRASQRVTVVKM